MGEEGRISVQPGKDSNDLVDIANLFCDDILHLTGADYEATMGAGQEQPGDIHLALESSETGIGQEGYDIKIDDAIKIRAKAPAGVFYGTRTVLQLLNQSLSIPSGWARDRPRYPERGMMVDIGRRHFPLEWLKAYIREMAYLKLNYLHLHFTEDSGWRIESEKFPEIVSDQHLTKDDVRELIEFADRHFVTIVPEIDMPAHFGAALEPFPEYQLENAAGRTEDQFVSGKLDITNPDALEFARELIEEYISLFPGEYWHIGTDEWMLPGQSALYPQLEEYAQEQYGSDANAHDALLGFINWADEIVRSHGKQTRMWHGAATHGNVVEINSDIVTDWWNDYAPLEPYPDTPDPQELLDNGHDVMNAGWYPTYLTGTHDVGTAYESWRVHEFHGEWNGKWNRQYAYASQHCLSHPLPPTHVPPPAEVSPDEPRNLGSKLHVWGDSIESRDEIENLLYPRLRMLAQKTWESPLLTPDYEHFELIMEYVGHAPGAEPHVGEMRDC